ncbi:FAD dependent oxidoreductase [Armillaria luteobubalina]|uniref:FAD dependent oxidoreductase n=1 Tax=Armillaria luteobubalina TaxID=153913 RepID=A0AA39QQF1_9AGAR|nr:FAD dependent oxidoreductase [Armillaria luteobubalina]
MVALFSILRVAIDALREIIASYQRVSRRIKQSPGLPVPSPTTPFWSIPASPIQKEGSSAALPTCADVVIIGSGITGTAFARTLLDLDGPLEVVMLEARDACSGATARNRGHITPPLYHDYLDLKKKHGTEVAKQIIQFRLSHLDELISVAEEEGLIEESQCRKVDTYDVYFDKGLWLGYERWAGGYAARRRGERGHLDDGRCGASVSARGDIRAKHIVHATNGWTSHLLAPMREKIVPVRGHMTAQRAGTGLDDGWPGTRSHPALRPSERNRMQSLCLAAASRWAPSPSLTPSDVPTTAKSSFVCLHTLAAYFGKWWGSESADEDENHFEKGRVKKAWSGVLGISADGLPWVGSLPSKVSGRPEGREWIAAGYSGEGMVHAWMSGKALTHMVLGKDIDWLLSPFRVTEKRWKKANIASLL